MTPPISTTTTEGGAAVVSVPADTPGPGRGSAGGRWRILYQAMGSLQAGDMLSFEEMGHALDLDFLDRRDRSTIGAAARRAARELQARQRIVLRLVRGLGYQVARPGQVVEMAHRHQARAVAEVEAGQAKIEAIDPTQVDPTLARVIEATAMAFGRQAVMMRQLDVRQQRLEVALDVVSATARTAITQVEETAHRVDTTQTEIAALQQRLHNLETRHDRPLSRTNSLPPAPRG